MILFARWWGWTLRHLEIYADRVYRAYLASRWPDRYEEKPR